MNIKEAAESWVDSFNAIQQGMIARLMQHDPDEWLEVTIPLVGDVIHVYDLCANGEIVKSYIQDNDRIYDIELFDSKLICSLPRHAFEVMYDFPLPMCGTIWSFNDSADNWWLEEGDGIDVMSDCGFRIFEHDEFGYFFSIDGIGYDYYEAHWIPLYNARGLLWHDNTDLKSC